MWERLTRSEVVEPGGWIPSLLVAMQSSRGSGSAPHGEEKDDRWGPPIQWVSARREAGQWGPVVSNERARWELGPREYKGVNGPRGRGRDWENGPTMVIWPKRRFLIFPFFFFFFSIFLFSVPNFNLNSNFKFKPCANLSLNYIVKLRSANFGNI
jgi:hypothetical protein